MLKLMKFKEKKGMWERDIKKNSIQVELSPVFLPHLWKEENNEKQ